MSLLNEKQRTALWLGIVTMVVMGVTPPWRENSPAGHPAAYAPLFNPPELASHIAPTIDFSRLILQWCLVGMVTGGLLLTAAPGKQGARFLESKKDKLPDGAANEPASIAAPPNLKVLPSPNAKPQSKAKVRTLKFPEEGSLGEILLESEDDPDYWESVSAASGVVTVPAGRNIQLEVSKGPEVRLSALKNLDPHAIQSLDLSGTVVKDEDLEEIIHFNRLNEIDLSQTSISDKGVEALAKIFSLKRVWLDNSRVTDNALKVLTALQSLEKLSFVGTEITESAVNQLKAEFPVRCEIITASGRTA